MIHPESLACQADGGFKFKSVPRPVCLSLPCPTGSITANRLLRLQCQFLPDGVTFVDSMVISCRQHASAAAVPECGPNDGRACPFHFRGADVYRPGPAGKCAFLRQEVPRQVQLTSTNECLNVVKNKIGAMADHLSRCQWQEIIFDIEGKQCSMSPPSARHSSSIPHPVCEH